MNQTAKKIKEFLTLILKELEEIGRISARTEEEIKGRMQQGFMTLDSAESLEACLKSTKTLLELVRDEVDELHGIVIALFREEEKQRRQEPPNND